MRSPSTGGGEPGRAARRGRSGAPIVPALDGFRAYAILGIVVLHLLFFSGALAAAAGTPLGIAIWGVLGNLLDVFFIVSGFVLFLPIAARRGEIGSLRDFAIARAARLLPAYWASLLVVLALIALFPPSAELSVLPGAPPIDLPGVGNVTAHLAGIQMPARMLDGDFLVGLGLNGPLWMISVILGFYLLLPLVARPYFRHPLIGLFLALMVTVLWKEAVIHAGDTLAALEGGGASPLFAQLIATDQLPGWAFSFGLGMTGAWAYLGVDRAAVSRRARSVSVAVVAVALIVFVASAYDYGHDASDLSAPLSGSVARLDAWPGVAYTASRGILIAAVVVGPLWLRRPFANRMTARLGELSYAVYLIHFPLAAYVGLVLLELPTTGTVADAALWMAVVIPASLAYALLSVRFVERPAARWSRRVRGRDPASRASPAPAPQA